MARLVDRIFRRVIVGVIVAHFKKKKLFSFRISNNYANNYVPRAPQNCSPATAFATFPGNCVVKTKRSGVSVLFSHALERELYWSVRRSRRYVWPSPVNINLTDSCNEDLRCRRS